MFPNIQQDSVKSQSIQKLSNRHQEFLFGGIAYSVGVFGLFPFYKTIFFQQLDGISWIQSFYRLKNEGFRFLYRGVLPPLLHRTLAGSIMFGVQSNVERMLMGHSWNVNQPTIFQKVISSVCAGWFEALFIPLERVQTLLQNKEYYNRYKHTFQALATLQSVHGIKELYRGLTPVLWRNSIGNGLYFCGHQWLSGHRKRRVNECMTERCLWNFVFGGLLGGFIGIITFPFNVAKTRMQSNVGSQFVGLRITFITLMNEEYNKPNIFRLYRGVPANFMRSIFSWGLITMTYQFLLEFYSDV